MPFKYVNIPFCFWVWYKIWAKRWSVAPTCGCSGLDTRMNVRQNPRKLHEQNKTRNPPKKGHPGHPNNNSKEGLSCKLASSIKSCPSVRIGPTISISVCARIRSGSSSRRCFSCRRWATSLLLNPWVVTAVATISPPTFASTGRWAWWGGTPGAHSHAQGPATCCSVPNATRMASTDNLLLAGSAGPRECHGRQWLEPRKHWKIVWPIPMISRQKQFIYYIPKKTCRIKRILVTNLKPLRNRPKSSSTSPV